VPGGSGGAAAGTEEKASQRAAFEPWIWSGGDGAASYDVARSAVRAALRSAASSALVRGLKRESRRARVSHLARRSSTCHSGGRTGAGGDAAEGGGRAGRAESACWGSNGAATSNRSGEPHTRQIDRNWYSLA
jgi:hypothetical protein